MDVNIYIAQLINVFDGLQNISELEPRVLDIVPIKEDHSKIISVQEKTNKFKVHWQIKLI